MLANAIALVNRNKVKNKNPGQKLIANSIE